MPHRCAGHSTTVISLNHGLAVALHSTDGSCRASVKIIPQVADAVVSNAQIQSTTLGCKEAQASHTAQTARDSLTPSPNAQNGPAPCLPRKHGRCGCTPCKRQRPTTSGTLAENHRNVCRIQHSTARHITKAHHKGASKIANGVEALLRTSASDTSALSTEFSRKTSPEFLLRLRPFLSRVLTYLQHRGISP